LIINSNVRHLQPLLAGFNILNRNKLVKTNQYLPGEYCLLNGNNLLVDDFYVNEMHLDVIINNTILVHYDVSDSNRINDKALATCDLYFKRSFCKDHINREYSESSSKILPLGLYFLAIDNNIDFFAAKRDLKYLVGFQKIKSIIKYLDRRNILSYSPYLKYFEQAPQLSNDPKVLFFAQVWDPNFDGEYNITQEDSFNRQKINMMRVNCIRELKRVFKSKFTGGIQASDFSRKYCKDLVIEDTEITERSSYIKMMQEHDICITTLGLHDSIGGKFAEYIASAKAIVTEKLQYSLPGEIKIESNYLEFSSVDDCLSSVKRLINDPAFRYKMMVNNFEYYHNNTRPDVLVKNTLFATLKATKTPI
jgi:hypothetical protein